MLLTPDASAKPPRPQLYVDVDFWHPRVSDIHYWSGDDGVPTIAFHNPGDGVRFLAGTFFSPTVSSHVRRRRRAEQR